MSTAQWILNCTLLGWVLTRNLGTKPLTRGTFLVPAAVVAAGAWTFLRDVPTQGNDVRLELLGTGAGAVLGLVAAALTRVRSSAGRVTVTAGAWFAALWVVVIGGRVAFAEWATHSGARTVGVFSMRHQITGADAWTVAFVLMALAMVLTRYLATALLAATVVRRTPLTALGSVA
jgi:hypothetical protein